MPDRQTLPPPTLDKAEGHWITLTPKGVLFAFSAAEPGAQQQSLQDILSGDFLPTVDGWRRRSLGNSAVLEWGLATQRVEIVRHKSFAPETPLDRFLSLIIGPLSSVQKAAVAAAGGFCVSHVGYSLEEAETLCAAAAAYSEFAQRQKHRGWTGADSMISFHDGISMLIPATSFIPFWVDGTDYCLIVSGWPLINRPEFVNLVWGIKKAGMRFSRQHDRATL